ncbi:hypothetical protein HHI36_005756 [Cryptolaemus montrouzieri]|uniref:Uncharacterized protein n=1 Tax=Cryptolaemus montrouzieri TaxID=559131 RepID=A0ABD2NW25_9CUCU
MIDEDDIDGEIFIGCPDGNVGTDEDAGLADNLDPRQLLAVLRTGLANIFRIGEDNIEPTTPANILPEPILNPNFEWVKSRLENQEKLNFQKVTMLNTKVEPR